MLRLGRDIRGSLGIAVSGGPDSLALLLLAQAAFPGRIAAATVDHQLRPEAAAEARQVAEICSDRAIPHSILTVCLSPGGEGVQGEARRARYAALGEWAARAGIAAVATGHHADDQAETLLMRLQRGSGVTGLAGVRARRALAPGIDLVRPLLGWRREELTAIVAEAGLVPADDPANSDPRFDRARMRSFLAANPELDPLRLARSAAALADAEQALAWAAERAAAERLERGDDGISLDPAGLPRELRRRLLTRAIRMLSPDAAIDGLDGLLDTLDSGGTGTLAGIVARGDAIWRLAPEPPRRPVKARL